MDRWHAEGRSWVCFFQDTNGLVFRGLIAAVGVSAAKGYDMNSQTVPRRAKEAIGAICRLVRPGAAPGEADRVLTINVEYNQLDPMLRGCGAFPEVGINVKTPRSFELQDFWKPSLYLLIFWFLVRPPHILHIAGRRQRPERPVPLPRQH